MNFIFNECVRMFQSCDYLHCVYPFYFYQYSMFSMHFFLYLYLEVVIVHSSSILFFCQVLVGIGYGCKETLLTFPGHMSSSPLLVGFVLFDLLLYMYFCRSLFVLLYSLLWPLCCLFFDIRIPLWYLQVASVVLI
jgi:hypothetical protein